MINDKALALIKEFEGLRLDAYQDPVGIWTIGYGTTAAAGVGINPVRGMVISEVDASEYLRRAVVKFEDEILGAVNVPITENQWGALVSLAYNIGPTAFKRSSLLRKLNAADYAGAADEFARWNKAGGKVLRGLTRRRAAERDLFVSADVAPKLSLWQMIINFIMGKT